MPYRVLDRYKNRILGSYATPSDASDAIAKHWKESGQHDQLSPERLAKEEAAGWPARYVIMPRIGT